MAGARGVFARAVREVIRRMGDDRAIARDPEQEFMLRLTAGMITKPSVRISYCWVSPEHPDLHGFHWGRP